MKPSEIAIKLIVSYYDETANSLLLQSDDAITTYVYENVNEKTEKELYSIIEEILYIKGRNAVRTSDFFSPNLQ